ncbi:hypothetical protein F5X68DRAFT_216099 [Plectosphaerella plurivora]|uniref:Hexosyltransferase n=1 Tax=Plectosphaerella plurivora TaxID=936078 RepID=A0A9P8V3I9_9PEZI|nr:hypothetical protein F5X68DRAFT_216099 [Plectosphaerella plurivora]
MAGRRISQRSMILLVPVATFLALGVLFLLARPELPPLPGFNRHPPPHHPPPPPPPPSGSPQPKVWEPPTVDPLIHGMHASDYAKTKHAYKLEPFPPSPLGSLPPIGAQDSDSPAPWLAAVICTPWDVERRMLIRSSWMRLYQDLPFDARFVVSNPGPQWIESIRLENSTFGDMIVLDTLREDDFTANTVKTLGFYRWLIDQSPRRYEFVSKMDTDLWLNARGFWDRYLKPRLSTTDGVQKATVEQTIIGQLYYSPPHKIVFPHGSMYTVTWDMVSLLADLQDEHHVVAGEDMAMAVLMLKGHQQATVVNMRGSEKFDFDERDTRHDGTAWAVETTRPTAAEHALFGPDVIAVHQLKSNELWLKVADCFDERGIKPMPQWVPPPTPPTPPEPTPPADIPPNADEETRKKHEDARKAYEKARKKFDADAEEAKKNEMRYSRSRFDAIPKDYWEEIGGTWLCNGIWKTPEGVDRNPELRA